MAKERGVWNRLPRRRTVKSGVRIVGMWGSRRGWVDDDDDEEEEEER